MNSHAQYWRQFETYTFVTESVGSKLTTFNHHHAHVTVAMKVCQENHHHANVIVAIIFLSGCTSLRYALFE